MWYILYGLAIVGIFPNENDALDYLADCIGGNIRPDYFTQRRAFAIQFIGKDHGSPVFSNVADLLQPPDLTERRPPLDLDPNAPYEWGPDDDSPS